MMMIIILLCCLSFLQLCDYIFELSQRFNQFYECCPVLQAESAELRHSRVQLCALTAGTIVSVFTIWKFFGI